MKDRFLPKSLNEMDGWRACLNTERGASSTQPHFHDCVEIIYVKRGYIKVFFDCEWHTLREGGTLFVPVGYVHCCISDGDESERVVIGMKDELLCDADAEEHEDILPFYSRGLEEGCILCADDCPSLHERMERLYALGRCRTKTDRLLLYAEVIAVYHDFYRLWEKKGLVPEAGKGNRVAREIEAYIRANCHLGLTAQDTAKRMHISYSYMAKILSRHSGMNFCDLVARSRADMAKKLLSSTQMSITDIGFECGFCATSAFIQSFKRLTGKTPLAYRKSVTLL